MNLRHLKLWKRHAAAAAAAAPSDVAGDVGKSSDVVDVRSPSSDSGYSDVAPTCSSMFGRQPHANARRHHGHLSTHAANADHQNRDRGRSTSALGKVSEHRKTESTGRFRGLRGSSTPRSGVDSTRRTLSPPSADVKSHSVPKTTTATTTSTGEVTAESFFAVIREGNVDKLRQFLQDTKFDVNVQDTVRRPYTTDH